MRTSACRQYGMTLVSVMISLTISLFLLLALYSLWSSSRNTYKTGGQLTSVHNEERLALTVMAGAVKLAGYYPFYLNYATPPPATPYSSTSFTAAGSFQTGQYISGTYAASAPGDSLSIRFIADPYTLDCLGQTEATGTLVTNTFAVNGGQLQCAVNGGTPQTIAGGISSLAVRYGVDTQGDGTPHQYMTAATVTTDGKWAAVYSVQVELTVDNPLSGQPGQPAALSSLHQTIALLQNNG